MEVIHGLENVQRDPASVVTVGSFDGLHLGHQKILKRMKAQDGTVTVLTFDPHPQAVVSPDKQPPPFLSSFEERLGLFERNGVDRLIVAKFDKAFAKMTAEQFVKQILVDVIGVKAVFVGPTHSFGKGRSGDPKLLEDLGAKYGFTSEVVEAVSRFGVKVSSSLIRTTLSNGDALSAWRYLGRPYYMHGRVIVGDGRGRLLGFPTANLELTEKGKLIPPMGIYCTVTEVNGIRWPSVTHFGDRPTFKGAVPAIETHLMGFTGEIYEEEVRLGMVDRMRDISIFPTANALVQQMTTDRIYARRRLAELGYSRDARMRIQRYGKIIG